MFAEATFFEHLYPPTLIWGGLSMTIFYFSIKKPSPYKVILLLRLLKNENSSKPTYVTSFDSILSKIPQLLIF